MSKSLLDGLEKVARKLLPEDPRTWCESYKGKDKVVHDAVWGTIGLKAHEVALVDTNLFQRLRRVHQLGAVQLVYPSARHTRFEHSLGVMHQAGRMCHALQQNGQSGRITDEVVRDARFAALLHDTGHGPFSHTSEQYFSIHEEFDVVRKNKSVYEDSGGGEMLSCLLVETEAFRGFLSEINRVFEVALRPETIAGYIAGHFGKEERFKSEIIHGPFDADKLDYMYRDGHFTGLQIPIDLDRLLYSVSIHQNNKGVCRLSGSTSATSPLMQIAFNKMLLFAGVYHHHKVRAVDSMLWSIFHIAKTIGCKVGGGKLDCPSEYLLITDDEVLIPSLCDNELVGSLIKDVRSRNIWKRALVISRQTVPEKHYDAEDGDGAFHKLISLGETTKENIERKIEIAKKIAAASGCNEHEVWLDIPKPPSAGEAKNMWIKVPGSDEPLTLGEVMPIQQWVDIYANTRYAAHVFCPKDRREEVNKHAHNILTAEFGLTFLEAATSYAKLD